eukprot:TRINITY_DN6142_c0_g1_i3.p3 TRINITY_DN6142_c0_g1~~TRINITY_DN6142_c0_g1_i3.p3  ORF type:complete len:106 (+),score=29.82 TRINITY_DN6142_c0_g1_i3:35-352(+)
MFVQIFLLSVTRGQQKSTLSSSSAASDVYKRQEQLKLANQNNNDSQFNLNQFIAEELQIDSSQIPQWDQQQQAQQQQSSEDYYSCLLYTSPSPRDRQKSRMPSSA